MAIRARNSAIRAVVFGVVVTAIANYSGTLIFPFDGVTIPPRWTQLSWHFLIYTVVFLIINFLFELVRSKIVKKKGE